MSTPTFARAPRHGAWFVAAALWLGCAACGDDAKGKPHQQVDAGSDAGVMQGLPRPSLERPPVNGLPADLKPPR